MQIFNVILVVLHHLSVFDPCKLTDSGCPNEEGQYVLTTVPALFSWGCADPPLATAWDHRLVAQMSLDDKFGAFTSSDFCW